MTPDPARVFNRQLLELRSQSTKVCHLVNSTLILRRYQHKMGDKMNFKLKEVINGTVDTKLKSKQQQQHDNVATFYEKHKNDSARVGCSTTYDVVGKRNYKTLFDEKKYKW